MFFFLYTTKIGETYHGNDSEYQTNFSICKTSYSSTGKRRQMSIGYNQSDFTVGQTTFKYSHPTPPPKKQLLDSTALYITI